MEYTISLLETVARNENYRRVLYTGDIELTIMSLIPGELIPFEIHENATQFVQILSGKAKVTIDDIKYRLDGGSAVIIPKGSRHLIENIGTTELKLFTVYSSPQHPRGLIQESQNSGGD